MKPRRKIAAVALIAGSLLLLLAAGSEVHYHQLAPNARLLAARSEAAVAHARQMEALATVYKKRLDEEANRTTVVRYERDDAQAQLDAEADGIAGRGRSGIPGLGPLAHELSQRLLEIQSAYMEAVNLREQAQAALGDTTALLNQAEVEALLDGGRAAELSQVRQQSLWEGVAAGVLGILLWAYSYLAGGLYLATRVLPARHRARYLEQWLADLSELHGLQRVSFGLQMAVAALRMRAVLAASSSDPSSVSPAR